MRSTAVAAASIALGVLSIGAAHAHDLSAGDWCRRLAALVQSLAGTERVADEIVAPPRDIDPGMAVVPPRQGTMRVVVPPGAQGERS